MERRDFVIHSSCLNKDMRIIQYGTSGVPFVGFPTQCGGAGNYEEFGMIRTLSPYLDDGRMQLFCVDSVDHESWYCEQGYGRGIAHSSREFPLRKEARSDGN